VRDAGQTEIEELMDNEPTLGEWILRKTFGADWRNGVLGHALASGRVFVVLVLRCLLAIAVLGAATSCVMHVVYLLGHSVTNETLRDVTICAFFLPFCLGMAANAVLGNLTESGSRSILRTRLSLVEFMLFAVVELYAGLSAVHLWRLRTEPHAVAGPDVEALRAPEDWLVGLALHVLAVVIVLTALRSVNRAPTRGGGVPSAR
jgi:hypothetical protein